MRLLPCSFVDINCLKGALLINKNGAEFLCGGIGISLEDMTIWVDLMDAETREHHSSVSIDRIEDWTVQFNSHSWGQF